MAYRIEKLFRAPYGVPNGLQVTAEGLWIADQITDRVALVEIAEPSIYGVTRWLREVPSESSNTSGLAYGDGSLWLAANGDGSLWRPLRDTDAKRGEVLRIDPCTGNTLARFPVPGGGGVHGIEYDHFESGFLWVTTLADQTLSKVAVDGWEVAHAIPLPHNRAHGVVRTADGVWVVFTSDRVILKLDLEDGTELGRIVVPGSAPEPHGLSICGGALLFCDATSGWITRVSGERI